MDADLENIERIVGISREIRAERKAQDAKWGPAREVANGSGEDATLLGWTFTQLRGLMQAEVDRRAGSGDSTMALVLLEEVFEALAESDDSALRVELIQVAAVAAKWVQIIDQRGS
jgi:hypothetical protein